MPTLTVGEFDLVYNVFSFTFAAMFASFIYFILVRPNVLPKYRGALTMSALVVGIAGYHYFRIFESWEAAFMLVDNSYVPTDEPFNDAYRYIDWLLTVPLLVAELVAVMGLPRKQSNRLTFSLAGAAALMVALGYPGEIADGNTTRLLWGVASTLPFLYIVYVLFTELGNVINEQQGKVRELLRNTRLLLLATWGFYPIVYCIPYLVNDPNATVTVAVQVGYAAADVAAKCGYGLMIYSIAREKTVQEIGEQMPAEALSATAVGD